MSAPFKSFQDSLGRVSPTLFWVHTVTEYSFFFFEYSFFKKSYLLVPNHIFASLTQWSTSPGKGITTYPSIGFQCLSH